MEMEELYAYEMAREISQKAHLQAQLHFRLMQMKEDRVTVETHLGKLNSSSTSLTKQDSGSLSKTNEDMMPTAMWTFMKEPTFEEVKNSFSQTSGGVKVTWGPTIPTSMTKVRVLTNPSHEQSVLVINPANEPVGPEVLLSPTMFRSPQDPPATTNPEGSSKTENYASRFVYYRDEFAQASE